MVTREFRKPLVQSAAILGGVFIIFSIIPSAGAAGGGIGALFSGIGNLILFLIGMAIAVPFSIAVLIAIFLGAVALMSRETAAQMYSDIKKNFSSNIITLKNQWSCCSNATNSGVSEEEYSQMKQEIAQLNENKNIFKENIAKLCINSDANQVDINDLKNENLLLHGNLVELTEQNGAIQKQFEDLSEVVDKIQSSGNELATLVSTLSTKVDEGQKTDLEDKLSDLALLQDKSGKALKDISDRLAAMETSIQETSALQPTPEEAPEDDLVAGIFSYIESDDDKTLFTMAVEEAVAQEMTYAKIDEYLTENLNPELDKIIKDHPSLTKTYIRNFKKD